jgi:hypothetical protein
MSRFLSLTLAGLLSLLIAAPALADGQATHPVRKFAQGAVMDTDDCPLIIVTVDTPCTGIFVFYVREDSPDGFDNEFPNGRAGAQFAVGAGIVNLVARDGEIRVLSEVFGLTFMNTGTYDAQHLDFASVQAAIPMSDGSTFEVDLRWSADQPRDLFGNDGPVSEGEGFPATHFRTQCLTANYLDHQKFRHATVAGTLGGVPTTEYASQNAAIINGWFHWTEVVHGNC